MIRYAIIENEDFALQNLKDVVQTIRPDYKNVFCAGSVQETLDWLANKPQVDLIFMDVELNDGQCFEIFRQSEVLAPVIFTTAYDAFIKNAFEANSIDYILKPVFNDDLERAIEKFERLRLHIRTEQLSALDRDFNAKSTLVRRLRIQQADSFFFIEVDEIAMLVSEDKYVFAYTFEGRKHLTGIEALRLFSMKLDSDRFFMLSRSCVTNIGAIKAVHKYFGGKLKVTINIAGSEYSQTVSAARRREFLAWLGSE